MGEGVSIDFKSSNRIKLSSSVQVLLSFCWFWGCPPWRNGGWVNWDGGWCGCMGGATCMHACTHMHVKHDKHGCLHGGSHLQLLYMYTCACMHVCVWGHPHVPRCPLPRATGSPKHQNSTIFELIKIIQFCLKILYLWTLLTSYRL